MIAAMVAPAGFLSIAMTRACLVSGPAAGLDDADADRLRDTGLAVFRAVDRAVAFGLDLDLFMGSSEVCATPSAASFGLSRAERSALPGDPVDTPNEYSPFTRWVSSETACQV